MVLEEVVMSRSANEADGFDNHCPTAGRNVELAVSGRSTVGSLYFDFIVSKLLYLVGLDKQTRANTRTTESQGHCNEHLDVVGHGLSIAAGMNPSEISTRCMSSRGLLLDIVADCHRSNRVARIACQ